MKREILTKKRKVSGCCPGHDQYPEETYGSNRSIRARARDKRREHRHVRAIVARETSKEVKQSTQGE